VRVSLNGVGLVDGPVVHPLSFDPGTGAISSAGGIQLSPSGEADGLQRFMTVDIPAFRSALDAVAVDLTTALNTTHAGGFHPGGAGGDLLSYDPTDPSGTLRVVLTDPALLATAGSAGPPFPANDSTNADNLAALRFALSASGGTQSIDGAFRDIVTNIAQQTGAIRSSAENADRLQTAALNDRESRHGVSLDEEMIALMEYQRMYEAATRVITAVDQALDVLVNRTGVVGR
jgi:flagellar hook-associated protein 1 FlgK